MIEKVLEFNEEDQSHLPEQYFLAKEMNGLRHIEVVWNCKMASQWFVELNHNGLTVLDETCHETGGAFQNEE